MMNRPLTVTLSDGNIADESAGQGVPSGTLQRIDGEPTIIGITRRSPAGRADLACLFPEKSVAELADELYMTEELLTRIVRLSSTSGRSSSADRRLSPVGHRILLVALALGTAYRSALSAQRW